MFCSEEKCKCSVVGGFFGNMIGLACRPAFVVRAHVGLKIPAILGGDVVC